MKKLLLFASLIGLTCASCASTKQEAPAAPTEKAAVQAAPAVKLDAPAGNLASAIAELPENSIAISGIEVEMAKLETNDPVHISINYPIFHNEKLDAPVLDWARDRMERMQTAFRTQVADDKASIEDASTPEEKEATLARVKEDQSHYDYECAATVIDYSPEKGASILFSESSFIGGPHMSYTFATLILDADGNETAPWKGAFASEAEAAQTLSTACREQFAKTDIEPEMFMNGTEPDPINFRWMIRRDNYIIVYFDPYAVASWAEGPQVCIYKLQ